ncbi:hypothetical protein COCNU_scaffold030933G000010 [Cocos nucifera]|nr:hypothetical protein [Cocos nucifera]
MLLEKNGHAYWKLEGHCSNSNIILQAIGKLDSLEDKWFAYDEYEEKAVEKHISSLRKLRHRRKYLEKKASADGQGTDYNSLTNSPSPNC